MSDPCAKVGFYMLLSEAVRMLDCPCVVVSDGEFDVLEQCAKVRAPKALTYLEKSSFASYLENENISSVICVPEMREMLPPHIQGIVTTEYPKYLFFMIHQLIVSKIEKHATEIDSTARVSPQAYIAPYGVRIGKNVEIEPGVIVCESTVIEDGARICCGTVIGGQGFVSMTYGGRVFLVRDGGGVLISNGVEICSNCNIARGTLQLDTTTLGEDTKLSGMVHIGHGTVTGEQVQFSAGVKVAGNCVIGNHVWFGINSTVSNRIRIGDNARVSLGAVVTRDVPAGETVSGNFAINHLRFLRNLKNSIKE